jgi:hypothetical protein
LSILFYCDPDGEIYHQENNTKIREQVSTACKKCLLLDVFEAADKSIRFIIG